MCDHFLQYTPRSSQADWPASSAREGGAAMDPRVERALNVQEFVARHPVVESASISNVDNGAFIVKARLSTTSYKTRSKTYYTQSYFVTDQDGTLKTTASSMDAMSEEFKMTAEHSAEKWKVTFKVTTVKEKKKRIVEIRDVENDIYDEIDVTDIHADFLTGEHWGRPTYLEEERLLVYVAEQHAPNWKDEDERERALHQQKVTLFHSSASSAYTAYTYAPNFGEQMSAQTRPGLFLLNFSRPDSIAIKPFQAHVQGEDPEVTVFRQPALAPGRLGSGYITVYATGSSLLPDGRRLGSIVSDRKYYLSLRTMAQYLCSGVAIDRMLSIR